MVTLRADDFRSGNGMDMWGALIESATIAGLIPAGTKSEDVEELTVKVTGATV